MATGVRWKAVLFFLSSGSWLASIGTVYSYPLWTNHLQNQFNLTQSDTGALGVTMYATQVAATVVPFAFSRFMASRYLFLVQLLSTVFLPVSLAWLLLGLASAQWISSPILCLYFGIALLGIGSGSLFIPVVSRAMRMLPNRSLFVSAYYALAYGVGATAASFALVWTPSLPRFFFGLMGTCSVVGLAASVILWQTTLPESIDSNAEKSKLLVQAGDDNTTQVPSSLKHTFLVFVKSPRSWLVVLILILNLGIGSTFAANMERFVTIHESNALDLSLLAAFFNVAQTVGRLVAVFVGSRGELTLLVVFSVALGFAVLLSLASALQNGAFYISLAFGIFYGAMRSSIASILFSSSVTDRKMFLNLALFTFPIAGIGPLGLDFLVGFLFEREGSFQWAWAMMAALSGISSSLVVVLWRLQPRQAGQS